MPTEMDFHRDAKEKTHINLIARVRSSAPGIGIEAADAIAEENLKPLMDDLEQQYAAQVANDPDGYGYLERDDFEYFLGQPRRGAAVDVERQLREHLKDVPRSEWKDVMMNVRFTS